MYKINMSNIIQYLVKKEYSSSLLRLSKDGVIPYVVISVKIVGIIKKAYT